MNVEDPSSSRLAVGMALTLFLLGASGCSLSKVGDGDGEGPVRTTILETAAVGSLATPEFQPTFPITRLSRDGALPMADVEMSVFGELRVGRPFTLEGRFSIPSFSYLLADGATSAEVTATFLIGDSYFVSETLPPCSLCDDSSTGIRSYHWSIRAQAEVTETVSIVLIEPNAGQGYMTFYVSDGSDPDNSDSARQVITVTP